MIPKSPYEIVEETIQAYEYGPRSYRNGRCCYLGDEELRCAFSRICKDTPEVLAILQRIEGNSCFSDRIRVSGSGVDADLMTEDQWRDMLKPEYDGHPGEFYQELQNLHDGDYWELVAKNGRINALNRNGLAKMRDVLRNFQLPLDEKKPVATAYEMIEDTMFNFTRNFRSVVPRTGAKGTFCRYISGDGRRCAFSRLCKDDEATKDALTNLEGCSCFDGDENGPDWRSLLKPRFAGIEDDHFYRELQELHDEEGHWEGMEITLQGLQFARTMMSKYHTPPLTHD